MISQLTIQNFGLIDQLAIEFSQGLNVLTGETGAGKSIVIDAFRYALGERLNSSQIRDPQKPCLVEATFYITDKDMRKSPLLADYLTPDEPFLIIQRLQPPEGHGKIKINGFSVTLAQLKEIGNHLVDFHGPHDHQLLFSEDSHLGILDRLADFGEAKDKYGAVYTEYSELRRKLDEMQSHGASRERELDLLLHQIKELEQVALDPAKYEELCQEQVKLNNSEKLFECVQQLVEIFENSETGIDDNIRRAFSPLTRLNQIDEKTSAMMDELSRLQETSGGLLDSFKSYSASLTFDPEAARDINRRYDIYEALKRKYGPAIEDVAKFYGQAKEKYELLVNFEQNDAELRSKIQGFEKKLKSTAGKLTEIRQEAGKLLKKTIETELKELGFAQVKFESRLAAADFGAEGQDKVAFYISPNVGEDLKPLAEIVSSGEAARVMLALKKALIKVDPIPVLIFDEIDAQIGGRLGSVTGKKLKEISSSRQVLLITHLPQIASFADAHFKVTKSVLGGRTQTQVLLLDAKERVKELAKMMSGENESKISLTHAEDLLASAKKA